MKIACLGECMLELVPATAPLFALNFGGDTFNTALYSARHGADVSYVTALGTDPFSDQMLSAWSNENIDTSIVARDPDKIPGLYAIQVDDQGERSFSYWRNDSAARHFFAERSDYFSSLRAFHCLYLSGITLSLFSDTTLSQFIDFLSGFRSKGGRVAFDLNYRPKNWPSKKSAQDRVGQFISQVDIAFPSFEDEQLLFGDTDIGSCIARYLDHGVRNVILKNGTEGVTYGNPSGKTLFPIEKKIAPRDTTAAGDSFNGAFLASYFRLHDISAAIHAGQRCASIVIQHPGAIVDARHFQG